MSYKFNVGESYGVDNILIGILNRELINKNKIYHVVLKINDKFIKLLFMSEESIELTLGLGKEFYKTVFEIDSEQYKKDLYNYGGQIVYVPLQYLTNTNKKRKVKYES